MTEPQGEETPVIVTPQGEETPVIEGKPAQAETTQNIPNAEWQKMQENLHFLNEKLSEKELREFETENPIVKIEKYKDKWADLIKQKRDPHSKYAKLTYEELLKLIREPEIIVPKSAPQTMSVPSLNPSVSPDIPSGKTDPEARKWLEARYSKEQIEAAESVV